MMNRRGFLGGLMRRCCVCGSRLEAPDNIGTAFDLCTECAPRSPYPKGSAVGLPESPRTQLPEVKWRPLNDQGTEFIELAQKQLARVAAVAEYCVANARPIPRSFVLCAKSLLRQGAKWTGSEPSQLRIACERGQ